MPLRAYIRKRDFSRTPEPRGERGKMSGKARRFVIQKHDASHLHYDFRLELDGVLKSWAVPKGMPFKKGEKRLAVQVEDHPLEYAEFEGVIPKGHYGGGTVMLWDTGTYGSLSAHPLKDLEAGKLHVVLHGKKLNGEWALVRTKGADDRHWLLIKTRESVPPVSKTKNDGGRKKVRLEFIPPMKATLAAGLPAHGEWLYELKFDGYRALALKNRSNVQLLSSNGKDFAARFPGIVNAVTALPAETAVFDGEIAALDDKGRSSFQMLQALETEIKRPPLVFYIFDLLHLNGTELLNESLHRRRKILGAILRNAPEPIRYSAEIRGNPEQLLDEVRRRGLEGIIGKERDSIYEPGRRSHAWIKLKCRFEQEFVIGGYTPPEGTRRHFGALLVGYYRGKELQFAGKVGTGFDAAQLKSLHKKMLSACRVSCPFVNLPEKKQGRWLQNITPGEMKLCHWIKPSLVCQIRFSEWTRDGKLRHPVFLGLREDKNASEVIRERPRQIPDIS